MEPDHAVLWIESEKRALGFYVNVLGLELARPCVTVLATSSVAWRK